ncbi:MAG: dual specificity protein phosphatase family protein [Planctomycetota bacterium]
MDKIFWIEEGCLAGRCGPSVSPFDVAAMKKAGIRGILSLDKDEHALIKDLDPEIVTHLIHFPNSIPPSPEETEEFKAHLPGAIEYVLSWVSQKKGAIIVHCHAGCDRTGGVLTGYLAKTRGIPPTTALNEVRKANPNAISAGGYEEMMLKILNSWV